MGTLRVCEEGFGRSKPQHADMLLDDIAQLKTYLAVHPATGEDWYKTELYPTSHNIGEEVTVWHESYRIGFKR